MHLSEITATRSVHYRFVRRSDNSAHILNYNDIMIIYMIIITKYFMLNPPDIIAVHMYSHANAISL